MTIAWAPCDDADPDEQEAQACRLTQVAEQEEARAVTQEPEASLLEEEKNEGAGLALSCSEEHPERCGELPALPPGA